MDAMELIKALDFIKNEEVYTQRYQTLKIEQDKLTTSRFIVDTMEEAEQTLEAAQKAKQQYLQKLVDAKDEIEQLRKDRLSELDIREAQLNSEKQKLCELEQKIHAQSELNKVEKLDLQKQREQLGLRNIAIQQNLQEANDIKTKYTVKLNELRNIVNNN